MGSCGRAGVARSQEEQRGALRCSVTTTALPRKERTRGSRSCGGRVRFYGNPGDRKVPAALVSAHQLSARRLSLISSNFASARYVSAQMCADSNLAERNNGGRCRWQRTAVVHNSTSVSQACQGDIPATPDRRRDVNVDTFA
ncbi:hypothetical protein SKAU_G00085660 [Synaphobranchus kaupii]|uniref:Uncharacterized protein n=1 Tax=Synaphobranchus kaupii TaxID=118154 RepID=A0A9Q1J606_SYNKA|nr:hypothetical protein SKAU_G00085660 [Synaphobranchus kaupii]